MGIEDQDAGQVTLTGYIEVPETKRDAVRAALPEHIRLTRAETGCLFFEVTENRFRPGLFEVSELFVNAAAFKAHQQRAKTTVWARITTGIPRHYTITGLPE